MSFIGSIATSLAGSAAKGILGKVFGGGGSKGIDFQTADHRNHTSIVNSIYAQAKGAKGAGEKYGYHPLVMLGMNPTQGPYVSGGFQGDMPGQNLGRAIAANVPSYKQYQMDKLALERAELENELLQSQITEINNQAGDPPKVEKVPHEETMKRDGDTGLAAGLPPAMVEYDLGDGKTIELPYSQEGPAEALESLPLGLKHLKAAELYYKRYEKKTPGYKAAEFFKKNKDKIKFSPKTKKKFTQPLYKRWFKK